MITAAHRDQFYDILADLQSRIGIHRLADCHGRMNWPRRGVYFFFEPDEYRPDGTTPRVVRIGTHAVSIGSRTTLWKRLAQHKGTRIGGGNHRGSIFRLHVGTALLNRGDVTLAPYTWGGGSSAPRDVRDGEQDVERAVSEYIGRMPFLFIEANDEPGRDSIRSSIENNCIALLSCAGPNGITADQPSSRWLGAHADREAVRRSAMWNVRATDHQYDPVALERLAACAVRTNQP